jgi:hypothetical protein
MKNCIKLLSIFVVLAVGLLLANVPAEGAGLPSAPSDAVQTQVSVARLLAKPRLKLAFEPKPHDCDGGGSVASYCVYGHVYYGGKPVEGAQVTVKGPLNPDGFTDITEPSLTNPIPHYGVRLDRMVEIPSGGTITVTAVYNGVSQSVVRHVPGPVGQSVQVDVHLPAPCPGTAHKWQSDVYGQTPYQSLIQPNPPVCLSDDRCLYSTGGAVNHGTINGVWICSWDNLEGRQQGVWYQCEATRANAHQVIEGCECELVGGSYAWVSPAN